MLSVPRRRAPVVAVALFALSAAAIVGMLTAAPASADVPGQITGTVTDRDTGLPLSGVCITVGPPIRCWTYTNAAGLYQIDLVINGSTWDLYFLVTGYDTLHSPAMTVNGATAYDVQLRRTPNVTPAPTPTRAPVQTPPPVPAGAPTAAPLPTPAPTPGPTQVPVEQRIALFWQRVDALAPTDFLTAADIGQWARNVIDRDASALISVSDFRSSTATMQSAFDRVRVGAPVTGTADVEQRIALFWQRADSLGPADRLSTTDLGQWGLNVTDRDGAARIGVADFRSSTAAMQAAIDRAAPR